MGSFETVTSQPLVVKVKIKAALDELKKRGVKDDYCPRCDTNSWTVDLIEIPASSAVGRTLQLSSLAGNKPFIPQESNLILLAIVCKNCGYSIFHNLKALGL